LGWPIMLTHFFQIAYNLVDTYWLGRLGVEEVAAPTLVWPMVFLLVSIAGGLAVAGVALVSQYAGAKNESEIKRSAGQVMSLLVIVGTVISVLSILLGDLVLQLMGPEPEVFQLASPYIKLIFASMPFMFIIMVYSFILRGWGDTRTPMYISGLSVGLNIVLDPFLILGVDGFFPGLGVTGAGIATLIARSIGGALCLYLLFHGKRTLRISFSDLRIEKEKAKQVFRIGIPSSIGQGMVALGFVVMVALVVKMGTQVIATYGIGTRVINIIFTLTGGLTGAAVTMIGQNLGAGNKKRAGRVLYRTMGVSMLILLACSAAFYTFSDQIYGAFLQDKQVIEEGSRFFLIFGFSLCLFGVYSSSLSAFQAAGHTVPAMILGIARLWLMRVPISLALAFLLNFGVVGIWMGMGLSNLTSAIAALAWVSLGKWKEGIIEIPAGAEVGEV
ncbi:MAG: MATE family efflux transporter, partial [Thermoplasmata archaeon]